MVMREGREGTDKTPVDLKGPGAEVRERDMVTRCVQGDMAAWRTLYDRHFPEGARALGLNGAEIVFNPSATVAGLSEYLWKLEQPAHAVANQYFVGAINRPGWEEPWRIGEFYGQSYFVDPRGQFIAASTKRTEDDIVVADMDFDMIRDVRNTWQFFRDRRPETYGAITAL